MITHSVPGDKSISHRLLMLAPLADGTSRIDGLVASEDVRATAAAMRSLGVTGAQVDQGGRPLEIAGPIPFGSPAVPIDCGNSGTTARLLLGLIAGHDMTAMLDGDASLRRRPMDRVVNPLRAAGAEVRELGDPGRLPLEITGGDLRAIGHESPIASAQVKSALLFAGLAARVPVRVVEPAPSRDHSERLLRAMGVTVEVEPTETGQRISVERYPDALRPLELSVPGDFSSASYLIALALLGGAGGGIRLEGVGLNPGRTGFLRALEAMGASIEVVNRAEQAGEPLGDLIAEPSALHGVEVPKDWIPALVDEVPILACIAARTAGVTRVSGARELRFKESDRLAALSRNLSALGVSVQELADGLVIEGTEAQLVGRVVTEGDHRIAMAFGILGALPGVEIDIDEPACVEVSYPGFWEDLARIRSQA
ncbi:MAG: 3-phosphoshikimate 1-carboxyvinyltransferase [Myxococcota bacterium]